MTEELKKQVPWNPEFALEYLRKTKKVPGTLRPVAQYLAFWYPSAAAYRGGEL